MDDDTLTRARAVLATIHATREAGYLAAPGAWDEAFAPVIELDATPVLIRLAEAVGRLWSEWGEYGGDLGKVGDFTGAVDAFNAAAIDAALAELAAIDGGEVGR